MIYRFGNEDIGWWYYQDLEPPSFQELSDETNGNSFIPPVGYSSWEELSNEVIANRWAFPERTTRPAFSSKEYGTTLAGKIISHNVRAVRSGAPATLTLREWIQLCVAFGQQCAYCGKGGDEKSLCVEHYRPICLGGGTELANIVPSCRRCNMRKGRRMADEFIAELPEPKKVYARIEQARSRLGL